MINSIESHTNIERYEDRDLFSVNVQVISNFSECHFCTVVSPKTRVVNISDIVILNITTYPSLKSFFKYFTEKL